MPSGRSWDGLPAKYRRCEYLESTGTQWIDTGIKLSNESEVRCEHWQRYPSEINDYRYLYHTDKFSLFEGYVGSLTQSRLQTGARMNTQLICPYWYAEEKVTTILNIKGLSINGVITNWKAEVEEFESTNNLCLFGVLRNPKYATKLSRIYSFSVFRAGVLQLNFIPALDDTGTPCMYDTVSHTAFYNQGASEEEGGKDFLYKLSVPETKQLPYGYYPLSYLESTGTQYIDTGIKLSNESEVRCEFEPLDFSQNQYVYGACTNHLVDDFSCLLQGADTKICAFRYGTQSLPASGIKNTITKLKHSKEVYIDDKLRFSFKDADFESMFTCRVFDRNGLRLIGRIYSFSIRRNGQLQLDFQPCLDDKGVPCMYDFVSGKSFYNKDTESNFLYEIPAEIAMLPATMALREEKVEYGILTKNGLRRLYHPAKKLYFLPVQLTAYALENGYKPIIENEKPTDGNWAPVWTETEDEIILTWEEINEDEYIKNW